MTSTQPCPTPDEMTLSAHAHGDGVGHLFRWQDGLYRAIRGEHAPFFKSLYDSGVFDRLADRGLLVRSTPQPIGVPGYELVFQHDAIRFVTYPTEWCGAMHKAAALCTLDLQIELLAHDATLGDAHAWNILFDASAPTMVDLTAIAPRTTDGRWQAEDDFRFCMLYPTLLASRGRHELGRLLTDTLSVRDRDLTALLPYALANRARHLAWRIRHRLGLTNNSAQPLIRRLSLMREKIDRFTMPATNPGVSDSPSALLAKQIDSIAPETALVVNASASALPFDLARLGVKTLACDPDEKANNGAYAYAQQEKLDLLPLAIDLFASASTFGTFDRETGPIAKRLGCDLVVYEMQRPAADPLAKARADQRAQTLAAFAKRTVLVRITDAHNAKSKGAMSDQEVEGLFKRHARTATRLDSDASEMWVLCAV